MVRCVGIEFLNQCEYAILCGDGIGCKFKGECDYQRPKIKTSISNYRQCPACGSENIEILGDGNFGCLNCDNHFA